MKNYTLETAGLDFKRIPLPDMAMIHPTQAYEPKWVWGKAKETLHLSKEFTFDSLFKHSFEASYKNYVLDYKNTVLDLYINSKKHESYWLHFNDQSIIENNQITVEENCQATVILWYDHEAMVHHGHTKIIVKPYGKLNLIKVQNNGSKSYFVDQTQVEVEKEASFHSIDVQLGGQTSIINYDTNLKGYRSHGDFKSIYVTSEKRSMDLSYAVNHMGKKATSEILGKGVMSGQSKKVFRGTLNFELGSTHSVGKEEEVVLLLSDDVKSDSIPALMCSEDDVIGEHGASIGRLDENQLFYLMSRGIAADKAKFLVAAAALKEVLVDIENIDVKNKALEALDRRLEDVI